MAQLQLEDCSSHLPTIDRLTQSASLLAGICNFNSNNKIQHQTSTEGKVRQEEEEDVNQQFNAADGSSQPPWQEQKTKQQDPRNQIGTSLELAGQEQERIRLINETIQLVQRSFTNSLKLEPKSIETIQSTIHTTHLLLTPLEELTLHTHDQRQAGNSDVPQLDPHLIFSQLQIKQNSLNQWIKLVLQLTPDSELEAHPSHSPAAFQDPTTASDDSEDGDDNWDVSDQPSSDSDLESSQTLSSAEADQDLDDPNLSYITPLNDADSTTSDDSSTIASSSCSADQALNHKQLEETSGSSHNLKKPSSLDKDGFFNLAEFESEVNQGENQMKKKLRRLKSRQQQSDDHDSDDDEDEAEELDLFSPCITGSMEDDDMDDEGHEQPGTMNLDSVADLRYDDFFAPVKSKTPKSPNGNPEKPNKGKGTERKDRLVLKDELKKDIKMSKSNKNAGTDKSDEQTASAKVGRVKFSEQVTVKEIPAKNRGLRVSEIFGTEHEEDSDEGEDLSDESATDQQSSLSSIGQLEPNEEEDESMEEEDSMEQEDKTMRRLDSELFDDGFSSNEEGDGTDSEELSTEDEEGDKNISRHAKKMKILSREIARLEAENVAKKGWMLKGEASSKDRPENSLLEQDLDFEHVQKIAPAVTEEKTLSLESLIKQRILEANYDDVARKRLIDPKAFLPSRLIELSDAKPTQSLTEIYEESYTNNKKESETGVKPTDIRDEKLEKQHAEIKGMFESLSNKLDGLSNAHFTPPEPKIKIKTINDLPTISLESSLPTATGTGTLLAPEEIFNVKNPKNMVQDVDSLTHSQKQNLRTQAKKMRKKFKTTIIKSSPQDLNSKGDSNKSLNHLSTKDQKQASLDQLKKLSSNLNSKLTSNTSITLLNKRGLNVGGTDGLNDQSKQRKLVDGSAFKL